MSAGMSDVTIEVVRDALADLARMPADDRPSHGEAMRSHDRANLDDSLRAHDVELSAEQLDVAHHVWAQRTFMGGNYTLDARAIVAAVGQLSEDQP
jgi:hypothetical protein